MFWFIYLRDREPVDPHYFGFDVWHDLIREAGKFLIFEQIFFVVLFIAIWSVGFHKESGTGSTNISIWKRIPGTLSNVLFGCYMLFNATGLVWMYHRSLNTSWGPFTIFFALVYLMGGSWLLVKAISPRTTDAGNSVPLIHDDKRVGGFFAAGILVLIPVTFEFYNSYLVLTALMPPFIAVASIFMICRKIKSKSGSTAEWKPRMKRIVGLLCVWMGIFLFVCFIQRVLLMENGWHLFRRLMTSMVFLLFGVFLHGGKISKSTKERSWSGNRVLKIAAALAVIVTVWRFGATAILLPSMHSEMNDIRYDIERNNCNRMGEIPVDLPVLKSSYYEGSTAPDCDKWYQVLYVGKTEYYMNPTALHPYMYYGDIKLTEEVTLDKISSELSKMYEFVRKYPEELGDFVLVGIDKEAAWSQVLKAINSITKAGFSKIAFIFHPYFKSDVGRLLADPPLILRDLDDCRDGLMIYGGSRMYVCTSKLDKVGAFCPEVHNSQRWWGSNGTALERYRALTIPHMTESYAWCLGDMDLRAFETVMAFMFWQQPLYFVVVTIAPDDDTNARVLSIPANQRWEKAHAKLIGFVKDDRQTRDLPIRLTVE